MDKSVLTDLEADDQDQPVVVLNLYRFRDKAENGAGVDGLTGQEVFGRFAAKYREVGHEYGGEAMWLGEAKHSIVGEEWDMVALMRYPSRGNLVRMLKDPRYAEVLKLRAAAIVDSRIVEMTELKSLVD